MRRRIELKRGRTGDKRALTGKGKARAKEESPEKARSEERAS